MTEHQSQEFAPHPAVDLTDQNMMFLVLEELGIASIQNFWLQAHEPEHEDAARIQEQALEFLDDLTEMLANPGDGERVVDNGWTGDKLCDFLRAHLPSALNVGPLEGNNTDVARFALEAYVADIKLLTDMDEQEQMMGRKLDPKIYIDFMKAWSGIFSGKDTTLELPMALNLYKARHR